MSGVFICKECNAESKRIQSLSMHIAFRHKKMSLEKYYVKHHLNGVRPVCACGCGQQTTFINISKGFYRYLHNHSSPFKKGNLEMLKRDSFVSWNTGLTKETDSRLKTAADKIKRTWSNDKVKSQMIQSYQNTMMKKYGVRNGFQLESVKDKCKKSWIKKYGFDNPNKSDKIKNQSKRIKKEKYGNETFVNPEKAKQTCLIRYGVSNPNKLKDVRDKIKQTSLKRYGVNSYTQTQEYKEKAINTNLKRYGYTNASQSPEVQQKLQKNSYRFKSYILPSGKEIRVQGYEPFALKMLLKTHHESDIVVDRKYIPKFWYTTNDGKKHIYYPDIFIKSSNTVVETKSAWTNTLHLTVDKLKEEAVLKEGYGFQKLVFDRRGNVITI